MFLRIFPNIRFRKTGQQADLFETVTALRYGKIDSIIYSAVSRDSGKTMNQLSDLRLGARLLCTATVFVCIVFASAALIPALRGKGYFAVTGNHESDLARRTGQTAREDFSDFQTVVEPLNRNQIHSGHTGSDVTVRNSPAAQMITRTYTVGSSDHGSDLSQSSPAVLPHGVHVPVNVHPVTVNVDGSGFADQLSRISNGIDGILAAQRDALPRQLSVMAPKPYGDTRQNMSSQDANLLTQIDAGLRELFGTVESLRAESRTAVTQLRQEFKEEFQLTFAEHRKNLRPGGDISADLIPGNTTVGGLSLKIRCTPPGQTPETEPKTDSGTTLTFTENQDAAVEQSTQQSPDSDHVSSCGENKETVCQPLAQCEPDSSAPAIAAKNPDGVVQQSTEGVSTDSEQESAVRVESPDAGNSSVQIAGTQVKMEGGIQEADTPFFPFTRPETDRPVPGASEKTAVVESKGLSPRRLPISFKRTFSFAMPSTDSPTSEAECPASKTTEQTESSSPMNGEKSTVPIAGSSDGSERQFGTSPALTQKMKFKSDTGNRNRHLPHNPRFTFPKQTTSRPARPHPQAQQSPMAHAVKAVQNLSGNPGKRVSKVTQTRPRHRHLPTPSRMEHPTVLHRLSASIRSIGRVRTVE